MFYSFYIQYDAKWGCLGRRHNISAYAKILQMDELTKRIHSFFAVRLLRASSKNQNICH